MRLVSPSPSFVLDIDRVSTNVIEKDFEKDERLFEKLVKLYNEDQMMTKDGFSLRDLSLQCAVSTRNKGCTQG